MLFLSSRDQKIKNITKIEQKIPVCLHSWFHFLWRFSRKRSFTQ